MTAQPPHSQNSRSPFNDATRMMQAIAEFLQTSADATGDLVVNWAFPVIEQGTEFLGHTVAPIADIPLIKFATRVPGVSWILAAVGQVNPEKVRNAIADLRRQHPLETDEQLAHRVMVETTWQAAQVGLLTNIVPPVAAVLFAIDIGAVSALQANMIYRIAAIYGFSPEEVTRRGEVLAIWGIATGSSSTLKSGLSLLEVLPAIGTAIGITSDAAIIYGVGFLACRYYEIKKSRQFQHEVVSL